MTFDSWVEMVVSKIAVLEMFVVVSVAAIPDGANDVDDDNEWFNERTNGGSNDGASVRCWRQFHPCAHHLVHNGGVKW